MCGLTMMLQYCFRPNWTFAWHEFDDVTDIGDKIVISELVI